MTKHLQGHRLQVRKYARGCSHLCQPSVVLESLIWAAKYLAHLACNLPCKFTVLDLTQYCPFRNRPPPSNRPREHVSILLATTILADSLRRPRPRTSKLHCITPRCGSQPKPEHAIAASSHRRAPPAAPQVHLIPPFDGPALPTTGPFHTRLFTSTTYNTIDGAIASLAASVLPTRRLMVAISPGDCSAPRSLASS